jgi:hypothetical protein
MDLEYRKKWIEREFSSDVKKIIAECCGCAGQNYKMKVPLTELIEYKFQNNRYSYHKPNQDELFKMHVAAADRIVELVKVKWPFLDLTGIDVGWTAQEIIDIAIIGYENAPVITLEEMKKHCNKQEKC